MATEVSPRITDFGLSFRISDDLEAAPMGPFVWITPKLNEADHWVVSVREADAGPMLSFTITDAELEAMAAWVKGHFERRRKYLEEHPI